MLSLRADPHLPSNKQMPVGMNSPLSTIHFTLGLLLVLNSALGCGSDSSATTEENEESSTTEEPSNKTPDETKSPDDSTNSEDESEGSNDTDDATSEFDCSNLPAIPTEYITIPGAQASEDFVFDTIGNIISAEAGNLYRAEMGKEAELWFPGIAPTEAAGTVMLKSGEIVIAGVDQGTLMKITPSGGSETLLSGLRYPNGVAVDQNGFVYVAEHDGGQVRRIDPSDGSFSIIAEDLSNPNGLAFAPGFSTMYIGSFGGGTVHAVDIAQDGSASNLHIYAQDFGDDVESDDPSNEIPSESELPPDILDLLVDACKEKQLDDKCSVEFEMNSFNGSCVSLDTGTIACWPKFDLSGGFDGLAVDVCGNVYVTQYVAAIVWRILKDGTVEKFADMSSDTQWIPNLHWGSGVGGWKKDSLYVSDREQNRVFELAVGIPGVPTPHLTTD